MKKKEFEDWHKAGHSGLKQNPFEQYCFYIGTVEAALKKDIDSFPLDKEGRCLDHIYLGQHFEGKSEKDLVNYRSAVKKYWDFRRWAAKNSPLTK